MRMPPPIESTSSMTYRSDSKPTSSKASRNAKKQKKGSPTMHARSIHDVSS